MTAIGWPRPSGYGASESPCVVVNVTVPGWVKRHSRTAAS